MTAGRRVVRLDWGPDHLTLDAVVAFVDDELDAGAHGRADAHLAGCPQCRAEVVAQRQARTALRAAAGPCLPSSLLRSLRAIPAEAELPPPPPGLGVTADGQFVLLRGHDSATPGDGRTTGPRAAGPHRTAPGGPRRPGRRARFGAVSGLALGALAVGALAGPAAAVLDPAAPPAPGVLGGAVLDVPDPAGRAVPGEAVARLDVGPTTRPVAVDPAPDPTSSGDPTSSDDPTPSDDPTATPSAADPAGPDVVDASLRQRLERAPIAFHPRVP